MENNVKQEEVFSQAESICQNLRKRELQLISKCLDQGIADSNEIVPFCQLLKKYLEMHRRGIIPLHDVITEFIEEFDSMEWSPLSEEEAVIYLCTS
jgi:hypothetical protein